MQSDTGAIYLNNKPTSKGWVYLRWAEVYRLHENVWLDRGSIRQNET